MSEKRYQVFISSTFDDLKNERSAVWQELTNLGYIVSGMETFPATSNEQFEYIKKQIDRSDFYILIIGGRYGTISKHGISFTELEYNYADSNGIPVVVFPISDPLAVAVSKSERSPEGAILLSAFRERAMTDRNCRFWENPSQLASAVGQAVRHLEQTSTRPGWHRSNTLDLSVVTAENEALRAKLQLADGQQRTERETDIDLYQLKNDLKKIHTIHYTTDKEDLTSKTTIGNILFHIRIDDPLVIGDFNDTVAYIVDPLWQEKSIRIYGSIVDKTILLCQKNKIINIMFKGGEAVVTPGENWLIAHRMARNME